MSGGLREHCGRLQVEGLRLKADIKFVSYPRHVDAVGGVGLWVVASYTVTP